MDLAVYVENLLLLQRCYYLAISKLSSVSTAAAADDDDEDAGAAAFVAEG